MLKKSVVATLTLFCFLLVYVVPAEALHSSKLPERSTISQRTAPARETKPAHKVESELRRLERLFDRLEAPGSAAPGRLSMEDRQALRDAQALVRTEGDQILSGLGELSERLRQIDASAKIQERHARQVERVAQGLAALTDSLGRLSDAGAEIEAQRLGEARRALAGALGAERHNPVDPRRLPFRSEEAQPARLSAESARSQAEASTQLLGKATAPGPADLAATPDVQLSPGIQALAETLGNDPLAIYNWVRQNVLFVPTFGSIQGSEGCRLSRECNAHDSASLLVALLRASGVPARYVLGTVEIQPDRFKKIVGDFQDVEAAIRLSASGGIPTTALVDAANQATAVRIEHAWVEAFVDYVPSRGAAGAADGGGNGVWVPLDPSLKAARFQAPVDLEEMTGTDLSLIGTELVDSATPGSLGEVTNVPTAPIEQRLLQVRETLQTALAARPELTVGEFLGTLAVDAAPVPVLPASLPARLLSVEARTAELPVADRHRIILQNLDETGQVESVRLEVATAEIAGRRLTLHYLPDSEEDAATLEAMGGFFRVPPHLIDVRPVFFLGGELAEVGTVPARMGSTQRLRITFQEPGRSEQVEHRIAAGTFAAVGLDLQRISEAQALQAQDRLARIRDQIADLTVDSPWDDLIGEPLHTIGLSYFQQVETASRVTANASNVAAIKRPAEGLVTFAPTFAYLFGTAVDITGTGFSIDVRRYVVSAVSRVGSVEDARAYVFAAGVTGSAAEHAVFELLLHARSVSAVRLLAEANARGIPIFEVTSANLSQVLPQLQLSSAVRSDIANAVRAGQRVLVPRQQLTFLDWTGVGYLVIDPETGAGGYLISGGLAGGGTAEPSRTGDTMDTVGDSTGIVVDGTKGAKAFLGVLRSTAKAFAGARVIAEFFESYGFYFALFSATAAGHSAFQKTGDHMFAVNVFFLDLLTSILLGEFIGWLMARLAFTGIFGAIAMFALVVLLSVIVSQAMNALVDYAASQMSSALAALRRGRDRRSARRRPRRKRTGRAPLRPLRQAALAFLLALCVTLPAAAQPTAQGAAFLLGSQTADGSWESPAVRRVHATAEGLRALQKVAPGSTFARALADSFLLTAPIADTDDRAQRLLALAGEGRNVSSLAAALAGDRAPDGGWGITAEFAADPLDTALALQALAGRPGIGNDVLRDALARLLPMQQADGGFPCVEAGDSEAASEIWCTGQALLALAPLRGQFLIDTDVQEAAGFLRGRVDASGRFGPAGTKEVIHTALSTLALAAVPAFGPEVGAVRSFLEGKQRPDGSWDGNPYTTALALRALDALAGVPFCGDGLLNQPGEACDGLNLGGLTCQGAGLGAGTLSCTAQCTLDTSACAAPPVCGAGLVDTDRSELLVVGQIDGTRVTITPKGSVLKPGGGVAQAGVPFEVTLNRGEGVRIEGLSRAIDLTGTRVQSDRPVAVLNGNKCANVPFNKSACDHIFETAHPVHTWGRSALVTNLPFRPKGSIYRVVAAEDGTEVRLDGALQTTLNRGGFLETPSLPGSHLFEANRPIFVTQYMTSHSEDQPFPGFSIGDPSMVNMIPPGQYQNEHTFATVGGNQFDFHFLSVIAPDSSLGSVLLDGAPMASNQFSPIGTTGFSAAVVEIEEGSHTISSPEPHGITVEGMDLADSYVYPGGARMEFLNPFCGDGRVNLSFEQCDGRDFKGATCAAFGFPSGSLQCNAQCRIDTAQCSGLAVDDADGDGFPVTEDCNDSDASVNPSETEIPGNGKDDDCNPGTPDVIPPGAVTCRLVADRAVYSAMDLVGLDAVLESSGGLLTLTGLTASLDVHAIGGEGVFAESRDLAPLPPGARLEHPYSFAAFGHAPGDYEAVLTLTAGGNPSAQCSAVFAIDSSAETGAGLVGDLALDPEAVETGTASSALYTVENRGNAPLTGLGLRVLLLDASTGAFLAELADTATLAPGGTFDGSRPLATAGLQPATYLVVLAADLADGSRLTLDSATLRVEALSNTPPSCSTAIAVPGTVWPPNHQLMDVALEGITDAEGDPLAVTFTGIFQDEPTNAQGDGNQCPDATGVGTATAKVRAERSGNGSGRVYHLRFTADDGRGGTCQGEVKVCVPKTGKGGCVDEGAVFDAGVCQ